jgi:DNA-binding CsgD family transcriptional regulator
MTDRHQLTPKEHAAWTLQQRGMSEHNIALALGIGRWAVRERLRNAHRKLATRKDDTAA